jgi:hypothetical protein
VNRLANLRKAAVRILTAPPGIMTGAGIWFHALEAEVTESDRVCVRYVIVGAYYPQLDTHICDEIARDLRPNFKGAEIYFTTKESEGEAEVYVPAEEQAPDPFLVASAIAVIKVSRGMEEVNTMKITFADESVRVTVMFEDKTWVASLIDTP